jgi:hypothetical protein
MPTTTCPHCAKTLNKRGAHQHIRHCTGGQAATTTAPRPSQTVAAFHGSILADAAAFPSHVPALLPRGLAVIEFGAFRRELVFETLTDLQSRLTVLRFESADLLALLGLTPQALTAVSLPEHQREQAAARTVAPAPKPRRLSPDKVSQTSRQAAKALETETSPASPTKTCQDCGKTMDARGFARHLLCCQKRAAAATKPSATAAPSADPSLDITRRALDRCRREHADPSTNPGRKSVLADEIKTLEAKLAAAR